MYSRMSFRHSHAGKVYPLQVDEGFLIFRLVGVQDSVVARSACRPAARHWNHVGPLCSSLWRDTGPPSHNHIGGCELH